MTQFKNILLLILIICSFSSVLLGQPNETITNTPYLLEEKDSLLGIDFTAIGEELGRYAGYEVTPSRYLSLPYDATVNANVQGSFLDISYLLLMFLPIFFLGFSKNKHPLFFIGFLFLLLSIIAVSIPTAYSSKFNVDISELTTHLNKATSNTSFGTAPLQYISLKTTQFFNSIYQPIHQQFLKIPIGNDKITYPLLLSLIVGFFFLLNFRMKNHPTITKTIANTILLYAVLSLLLTGGIIWYSFLLYPIALIFLLISLSKKENSIFQKIKIYTFFSMASIWLLLSFTYRMTNYSPNDKSIAKQMFTSKNIEYQLGLASKEEVFNTYFSGYQKALDEINKDDAFVYRVGTFLNFFTINNHNRVIEDNQLERFSNLAGRFPDKYDMTNIFRNAGIKYIVVDLNTATLDQTPEQTLKRKFDIFIRFLYQNDAIEIISTNRIVKQQASDGSEIMVNDIFGDVVEFGNFAAYRIK